jgi:hypothetical protein
MASRYGALIWVACLAVGLALTAPGMAQTRAKSKVSSPADSTKNAIPSRISQGEGELIQLEDVQIKGEIAQPNVAITVSRAEPRFKEITLEHTAAEGLSDLDLSGLREGTPPPDKIRNWKEMVKRARR